MTLNKQWNIVSALIAFLMLVGLSSCSEKAATTEAAKPAAASTAPVAETVTVKDAYIRAMPPGQKVTALFMTIDNPTATAHDLVKAESDVSETVELHEHKHVDGMMKMGQVANINIPANGSAVLKPGGYHVMLIGLKQDLAMGQKVDVKLTYEDDSSQTIQPEVKAINPHN